MESTCTMSGKLRVRHIDQFGQTKVDEVCNTIMNIGKSHMAALLANSTVPAEMTRMAVGTGTTAPDATQTALVTELAGSRKVVDSRINTNNQIVYEVTYGAGEATSESPPITEAGIFNNAVGGDMLCRAIFTGRVKGANDILILTWTITFA